MSLTFLIVLDKLLITLLLLEIMTFYLIFIISVSMAVVSDFIIVALFRVFVIEGVMALAGLVLLVSFRGSDYLSSSVVSKC